MSSTVYSRELALFLRYCETNSIKEAAEDFSLSVSSASRLLAKLEEDLGFALFDRTHRPMILSTAGRHLAHELAPDARHAEEVIGALRIQNSLKPELQIGFVDSMTYDLAPLTVNELKGMTSRISVLTGSSDRLLEKLKSGDLSVVVSSAQGLEIPNLSRLVLLREPSVLVLPKSLPSPPGGQWTWAKLALCGLPFIPSYEKSGNGMTTGNFLNAMGLNFVSKISGDNFGFKMKMVALGNGWTISHALPFLKHTDIIPELQICPLPPPGLFREIYVIASAEVNHEFLIVIFNTIRKILIEKLLPDVYQYFPWVKEGVVVSEER